ncbi:MAG: EpsG family protein [Bacteriovoracaceae bacterium]|nr:EpsG family protein [Bacteriovoracaceae bacterium]
MGGDWKTYLDGINSIRTTGYNHFKHEPLFYALNLISIKFSNYYLVLNLLSSICFFVPLLMAFKQSEVIKGLNVESFIYFIFFMFPLGFIILHIGFVRQGIASAFALLALVYFYDKKYFFMILALIVGQGFHVSTVMSISLLLLLGISNIKRVKVRNLLILSLLILGIVGAFLLFTIRKDYLGGYKSDGLFPRLGYISLFWTLLCYIKYHFNYKKIALYSLMFIFLILGVGILSHLTNTTTVVDRFAYYLIFPISFEFAKTLPTIKNKKISLTAIGVHFAYSFVFLTVWFLFSSKAKDWMVVRFWFF